jgi:hypothetical protein
MRRGCGRDAEGGAGGGVSIDTGGEEMRCVALDHAELVAGGKDGVVHRCVRVCVRERERERERERKRGCCHL